jgi:hypothetical protein
MAPALPLLQKEKRGPAAPPPDQPPPGDPPTAAASSEIAVSDDGSKYAIGVQWRYTDLEPWLDAKWQAKQDQFGVEIKVGSYGHGFGAEWHTDEWLSTSLIFDPDEPEYLALKDEVLSEFNASQGDQVVALSDVKFPASTNIATQVHNWMDRWLKSKISEQNASGSLFG